MNERPQATTAIPYQQVTYAAGACLQAISEQAVVVAPALGSTTGFATFFWEWRMHFLDKRCSRYEMEFEAFRYLSEESECNCLTCIYSVSC